MASFQNPMTPPLMGGQWGAPRMQDPTMMGIMAAGGQPPSVGVPGLMQPGSGIPVPGSMDNPYDSNPWPQYESPLMSSASNPPTAPYLPYTPPDPKDVAITGFDEIDLAAYQRLLERLMPERLEDPYAGISDPNTIREDVLTGSTGSPGAIPAGMVPPGVTGPGIVVTPPGEQAFGGDPSSITDFENNNPPPVMAPPPRPAPPPPPEASWEDIPTMLTPQNSKRGYLPGSSHSMSWRDDDKLRKQFMEDADGNLRKATKLYRQHMTRRARNAEMGGN